MAERPLTPRMLAVLRAIASITDADERSHAVANRIARHAAKEDPTILEPVRRHGRGAVGGSWSGEAAECHRILGPLGALRKRGLIWPIWEPGRATYYDVTAEGRTALAEAESHG